MEPGPNESLYGAAQFLDVANVLRACGHVFVEERFVFFCHFELPVANGTVGVTMRAIAQNFTHLLPFRS